MSALKRAEPTVSRTEVVSDGFYETDSVKKPNHVTCLYLCILLYSIVFHFVDVGYDIYVACEYFTTKRYSYFAWTIVFTLVPSIVIALISIRMYVEDYRDGGNARYTFIRIVLCSVGLVIQSAPLIRYFDIFLYAVKSLRAERSSDLQKQERYYSKVLREDADVALLRVFECYLESTPQQVLQITMLILDYVSGKREHLSYQVAILTLSFISMGVCMANYNKSIRSDQSDKKKISWPGLTVQFLWHLNFTVSRILAIAAMATLHPLWTCLCVACHWLAMTVWVAMTERTMFCGKSKISEVFFSAAVGLTYIFNFIPLKDGPTRVSYIIYNTVCIVENVIASVVWGVLSKSFIKNWIYYVFIILPILTSILSLIFQGIYYKFLHPNLQSDVKNRETNQRDNFQEQKITLTADGDS